jgi:hypothetical protein
MVEPEVLRIELNKLYDEIDLLDAEINKLLLKRKMMMDKLESGCGMLLMLEKDI